MNFLFASAELAPFTPSSSSGAAAWVAGLASALRERGHFVSIVTPLSRWIAEGLTDLRPTPLRLSVPLGRGSQEARIWQGKTADGVTLWLVERDEYYDRSRLFHTETGDYLDNASRFIFFAKIVVELAKHVQPIPEILHLHDWPAALAAVLARAQALPFRTVLTLHDLERQGSFWNCDFELTNLPGEWFTPAGLEFYGRLNLLKGGILMANQVHTTSAARASEILHEPAAHGLASVLQAHEFKLAGTLGGVDTRVWNPATDPALPAPFSAERPAERHKCRTRLVEATRLDAAAKPLVLLEGPLKITHGSDPWVPHVRDLLADGFRFLVLGDGDPFFTNYLAELQQESPEALHVVAAPSPDERRRALAGCDFLLSLAKDDAGGTSLLEALGYGCLPIALSRGAARDLVEAGAPVIPVAHDDPRCLVDALAQARGLFSQGGKSGDAQRRRAMAWDVSWETAAARLESVYRRALTTLPQPQPQRK